MIETLADLALRGGHDILAPRAKSEVTNDGGTTAKPSMSIINALGGELSSAGVRVSPDGAMRLSAVNACVRVYAESVASLPLFTIQRQGKVKTKVPEHPAYRLLHDRPNPWQTSFEWRELMERDINTRGNAYSLIERDWAGQLAALYPLRPDRVTVRIDKPSRLPYYQCHELDGAPTLSRENVFHLRGMSKDGYVGLSPIQEAMDAFGLTSALEQFASSLFANGALHRGVFVYKGSMTPEQYARMKESIGERFGRGLKNPNAPGLLDGDWEWKQTSMPANEAQFLEARNFQVEDIARLFRMPTPMIGHNDKASTYASAEQFFLAFVVHSLRPHLVRWEQAIKRDLFTENEQDLYAEFLVDGLLRGDIRSRYAAYAIARQWGWMCTDEIRERENMDPLPDGAGQIFLQPMNMAPAGSTNGQESDLLKTLEMTRLLVRLAGPELERLAEGQQQEGQNA